jgi:hypothetical protein
MNYRGLIAIVLSLSVVVVIACSGVSQKPAETTKAEGSPMTVKGAIEYNKSLGGYYVHGFEPGGELFIVNQDPKVLEGQMKSGKTLTIEGRIVRGAEYLFIEKIDGKPYPGK